MSNVNKADRPIFIGGLMKSGTSLLRVLLGQHHELYAGFETHWFDDDIRTNWHQPDSRRMGFLRDFFEIDADAYARALRHQESQSGDASSLISSCARRPQVPESHDGPKKHPPISVNGH